jgi:hypothetical protein
VGYCSVPSEYGTYWTGYKKSTVQCRLPRPECGRVPRGAEALQTGCNNRPCTKVREGSETPKTASFNVRTLRLARTGSREIKPF